MGSLDIPLTWVYPIVVAAITFTGTWTAYVIRVKQLERARKEDVKRSEGVDAKLEQAIEKVLDRLERHEAKQQEDEERIARTVGQHQTQLAVGQEQFKSVHDKIDILMKMNEALLQRSGVDTDRFRSPPRNEPPRG